MKAFKARFARFRAKYFQKSHKTWFNAGLTPDIVIETENAGARGSKDAAEVDPSVSLALKRIQTGECPFCGIKTHSRTIFGALNANTVGGSVLNGHCLRCFPIAAFRKNRPQTPTSTGAVETRPSTEDETKSDLLLVCDSDRFSHVSELSGSFYCNINELS